MACPHLSPTQNNLLIFGSIMQKPVVVGQTSQCQNCSVKIALFFFPRFQTRQQLHSKWKPGQNNKDLECTICSGHCMFQYTLRILNSERYCFPYFVWMVDKKQKSLKRWGCVLACCCFYSYFDSSHAGVFVYSVF